MITLTIITYFKIVVIANTVYIANKKLVVEI